MVISFLNEDGGRTKVVNGTMALMHWLMSVERDEDQYIEIEKIGQIELRRGPAYDFRVGDEFIDQIVSCIEKNYGVKPVVPENITYDDSCLMLLQFLQENGKISELSIQ